MAPAVSRSAVAPFWLRLMVDEPVPPVELATAKVTPATVWLFVVADLPVSWKTPPLNVSAEALESRFDVAADALKSNRNVP